MAHSRPTAHPRDPSMNRASRPGAPPSCAANSARIDSDGGEKRRRNRRRRRRPEPRAATRARESAPKTRGGSNGSGRGKVAYDEKAIQTLDALEHIRLRTGMYIGRLGDGSNPVDGIYVMLKEVIDNSIDEFIMGVGKKIEIRRDGAHGRSARLRARHSARKSRGMCQPDQHRRQVQRRRLPILRGL